jgi:inorganic triphosphatase YgiF
MAAVLRLVPRRRNTESEQITRWLLAEMEKGRSFDYCGCFRDDEGAEHFIRTGIYQDVARALLAAARMKGNLLRTPDD